jgi:hypothetical protein
MWIEFSKGVRKELTRGQAASLRGRYNKNDHCQEVKTMGRVKNDAIQQYEYEEKGAEILIRAGIGVRCPICGEFLCEETDYTDAYKLGNYLFNQGDPLADFKSRREMTDAIKRAGDNAPPACYSHEISMNIELAKAWNKKP